MTMGSLANASNCSTSASVIEPILDPTAKGVFSTIYTLACVLGVAGNISSLIVFAVGQRCNTDISGFLINLAVADLAMTLICIPFSFTTAMLQEWIFPEVMCPILLFTQLLSVTVSVYTNTAISIDRFVAITYPMKLMSRSRKYVRWAILVIWLVSIALCSVQLIVAKVKVGPNCEMVCNEVWSDDVNKSSKLRRIYTIIILVITYIIPVGFIAIMYGLVCTQLWKRTTPGASDQARDSRLLKTKKMVVKMLITMTILFTISWMPVHLFFLIVDFQKKDAGVPDVKKLTILYMAANWLAMSNSFQNPIIYGFLNNNFRSDLAELLIKCCPSLSKIECIRRAALSNQPLSRLSTKTSLLTERADSRGEMYRHRNRSISLASRTGIAKKSTDRACSEDTHNDEISTMLLQEMPAEKARESNAAAVIDGAD